MGIIRLLNSLNMATFYVRFHSCFLLLVYFFVVFSIFLVYFYCFLIISICFPTDFMTFILKNPRDSMTSAKRSNVQTEANQALSCTNISGDRALIPWQSKKCPRKHGGFWPKILHFYITNLWYRPLTSYECGERG